MNLQSIFQLGLAFFGLTPNKVAETRAAIFTQIHEVCFHGQGGYQWIEVYNMPIWLRKFTYKKIQDFHKNQNEQSKSQTKKGEKILVDPTGKVNTPNFLEASKNYNKPSSYK